MTLRRDTRGWRVRAHAKINLTLRVLGIRPDGYHELRTTFQSLAMHDTLTLDRVRGPFSITSDDPRCPTDESNLVWKAAVRLWQASDHPGDLSGLRIHIAKRIPMEAGLGGGSSDAAATLLALRAIWRAPVSDADLAAIGRTLGADVPFFLGGGTALGVERGDLLFQLMDAPPAWVVVARPDFGVSTRDAYGWWDQQYLAASADTPGQAGPVAADARPGAPPEQKRAVGRSPKVAGAWRLPEAGNDLQAPVVSRHPKISSLIKVLTRSGAFEAAMSGSGSAVFGLFQTRVAAEQAAAAVAGRTVTTWLTRTTTQSQHLRSAAPNRRG